MLSPGRLDLVSLRLSTRAKPAFFNYQSLGCIRRVQQFATQHDAPPDRTLSLSTSPTVNRHTSNETPLLENLRGFLQKVTDRTVKSANARPNGSHAPKVSVPDIDKDLLPYSSPEDQAAYETTPNPDPRILRALETRLLEFEATASSSHPGASQPGTLSDLSPSLEKNETDGVVVQSRLRERINRLRGILEVLVHNPQRVQGDNTSLKPPALRLLSSDEWRQLSQACLDAGEVHASKSILELMKLGGISPSTEQSDAVLDGFARRGLVKEADAHVAGTAPDLLRDSQRDLLVKARVGARQPDEARKLLHSFEDNKAPAPMRSYTRLIQFFFDQRDSNEYNAEDAWELFKHMRHVAYPVPDANLYSLMIRSIPKPELSLRLFTQMVAHGIVPTAFLYNLVICRCAEQRTLTPHAFRLAREMLNAHNDRPDDFPVPLNMVQGTFHTLIYAARRARNLSNARWTFAQLSLRISPLNKDEVWVTEDMLTHMFIAYAKFRPPSANSVRSGKKRNAMSKSPSQTQYSDTEDLPRSSEEVLRGASQLWKRVIQDVLQPEETMHKRRRIFSHVVLTPTLLNAYMGMYFAHSPPSQSYAIYTKLYESLGVRRNASSYATALEAYATPSTISQDERLVALSFGRRIWKDWMEYENSGADELYDLLTSRSVKRAVERAWSAMIRLLTIAGEIDEAEVFLHRFAERYPPGIRKNAESGRSEAEQPPVAVPEDRIVPFFHFFELATLFHHSHDTGHARIMDYIDWLVRAGKEGAHHRAHKHGGTTH